MGKLTESLQKTTQQLKDIKNGINKMQLLGNELTENSFVIAETAMKVGYNYAQIEMDSTSPSLVESQVQLPPSNILDRELLEGANSWTKTSLKARFKTCNAAYKYLKDVHGIKLSSRSWEQVVTAFNSGANTKTQTEDKQQDLKQQVKFLEQRLMTLENQVKQQGLLIQKLISQLQ
jgi:hypothetical protein